MTARLRLGAALAVLATMIVLSCSLHAPLINSVSHRLVVHPDGERLSVFAGVSDQDGSADLAWLFVVHDQSELSWTLGAGDWQIQEEGSLLFVGSNGLSAPGLMPRGRYRVVLVDLAGERDERSFTLASPDTSGYALPTAAMSGPASVLVTCSWPQAMVLFTDSGGNVTRTAAVSSGIHALDALWGDSGWREGSDWLSVYALDPKSELGMMSWKIRLPD